ncbi:flagellar hook-length control protein FliK [Rhodanobacter umsongensis]|uniref:Flagellar hook-length control protein FliK n=1 Tax=Rhodanobacter umsongensis TaxID=633153 RepID=A0ABW0JL48_9GAMM
MTAHAIASTPTVPPPATRSTPPGSAPEPAAPGHFDHQLHAARQRHAPRDPEPSPMGPNARETGAKEHPSGQRETDAAKTADAQAPASATSTTAPSTPPAAEAAQASAPDAKAPTDKVDADDHAASALAGAMLALIGPQVANVLRPAAAAAARTAGVLAQAGKTVATDASAAMLLQLGDPAGAAVATANPTPAAVAGLLATSDSLLPIARMNKDASLADATPTGALPAPATPAAPTAPTGLPLPSPVGSQTFAQDLGQQVAWLGGQGIKQARIRLHPEELGSLDVKVSVTHGRVDVVFSAQHPAAVAAVQQSLPQLDHMLAQHGLSLGHAEVGQHDRGDRHGRSGDAGTAAVDEAGEIHAVNLTTSLAQVGLLDAFA